MNAQYKYDDMPLKEAIELLYQQVTSPASRSAADALFEATSEQLKQSYRPGATETKRAK